MFWTKWQKSVFSVTSLCTSWTLFGRLSLFVFFSNLVVSYTGLPSVLPSSSLELGCPLFLSLFRWSHTASIIFRSGLCEVHNCQYFISSFSLQISLPLAVCLGSLWSWKIKPFLIRHFPEEMAWWDSSPHILYSSTSLQLFLGGTMSACSLGGAASLPVVFGILITNAEKYRQMLIN